MRIARVAIGVAVALLVGGLGSAMAQLGGENAINSRLDPKAGRGVDKRPAAKAEPARAAVPATPATPATAGGPATPAAPATPAVPAAPLVPPGLSGAAPDTAPKVGVIGGGGGGKTGGSPAGTPEPSTLLLMGAGLAGVYKLRRRRR
jgi:hypothetical protein